MGGVPSNIILPFVGVSFSNVRAAGPAELPFQALLIGQKIASGTMAVDEQILVTGADEVGALAGYGSPLHRAAIRFFQNNQSVNTYIIGIADGAAATASTQEVTLSGTATDVGTFSIYLDGDKYNTSVIVGDTADVVGAAMVLVINADPSASAIASYAAGVLTLTSKGKGVAVGDITTVLNYAPGDETPAGLTAAISTFTAGTVSPDIQDALDVIGDSWFNVITAPYSDAVSLTAIEAFLATQASALYQRDAMYYTAKKGTTSELISFAIDSARNSQYVSIVAGTDRPHSIAEQAAAVAGVVATSVVEDPAVPLHRVTLQGILPVEKTNRWDLQERNSLASNGVATLTDELVVQTEGTVTMYLKNSTGASDTSYQYQNTVFILMALRYTFVQRILQKYGRAKLADSAERITGNQVVITPDVGRAEAIAWAIEQEAAGQIENIDQFKDDVICRRALNNKNRLEWILPPDLINQFIVGSGEMQFLL